MGSRRGSGRWYSEQRINIPRAAGARGKSMVEYGRRSGTRRQESGQQVDMTSVSAGGAVLA